MGPIKNINKETNKQTKRNKGYCRGAKPATAKPATAKPAAAKPAAFKADFSRPRQTIADGVLLVYDFELYF